MVGFPCLYDFINANRSACPIPFLLDFRIGFESNTEATGLLVEKENIVKRLFSHKHEPPSIFSENVARICIGIIGKRLEPVP